MNVISNVCSGAYLYKKLKLQFNNPFMWSVLHYKDLKELMTNFDKIDFMNVATIPGDRVKGTCSINVDNSKLLIEYVHYYQNSNFKIPTKIGANVHYYKIWEYTFIKYMERVWRMLSLKEPPVFLIMDRKDDLCYENTKDLIDNTKYKTIIFTNCEYSYKNENVHLIKVDKTDNEIYYMDAEVFIEQYLDQICTLLK